MNRRRRRRVRGRKRRFRRTVYNRIVSFKATVTAGVENIVVAGNSGPVTKDLKFKLADLGAGEKKFVTMFDKYKLVGVCVRWLVPDINLYLTGGDYLCKGYCYKDYDGNFLVSEPVVLQRANTIRFNPFKCHKWYIKYPGVNLALGSEAQLTLVGAAPKRNVWIDSISDSVDHYGLGILIVPHVQTSPQTTVPVEIQKTFYFRMKQALG